MLLAWLRRGSHQGLSNHYLWDGCSYPEGRVSVKSGLTIGHEAVGTIHALGVGVTGYKLGDRVLVGAITPCGQCGYCLGGNLSRCGGLIGGWKFGNTINGVQAEYALVPNAQANMAIIPDELRDEEVILLADIASTGFSASESAPVMLGDSVAVGLCAVLGAKPVASIPTRTLTCLRCKSR
jgi:alcohol dehydrogenase